MPNLLAFHSLAKTLENYNIISAAVHKTAVSFALS